jgi:hypothetical protein
MTEFIESFATQQLLPPWTAKDAHRSCFVFRMNRDLIAAYLEKYFNGRFGDCAPAPYHYEPVAGAQFGMVSATRFPNIASSNRTEPHPVSGGQVWDRIAHNEVYVAFPVTRYAVTPDGLMHDPRLVWVQPVVYSDNDTIVFSAREIWGSDMFLATINREWKRPASLHLDVGMIGMKTFDPHAAEQLLSVLHVRAKDTLETDLSQVLQANPDLGEFVKLLFSAGLLTGRDAPSDLDTAKYPNDVELNNLKQFRDCFDMGAAIYRAIVASLTSHGNVRNLTLYDASKVDVAFMWSDSLKEFLVQILDAKPPPANGPPKQHEGDTAPPSCDHMNWQLDRVQLDVELAFAFTADIDFRVLSTLHTYGVA